uniref:Gustatory receptor n=1 Tax=Tetranychus urticae TaxID=32264 RepID=T1KJD5_TETUR
MMILIKVLQCWIRNDEPVNFPEITINSIPSKLMLHVSSTSGTGQKCLFAFIMSLHNLRYVIKLWGISLDAVFEANVNIILYFLGQICIFSLFHLKYNNTFVEKVEDLWNDFQIEFDNETRKYFWTRKVFYYSATVFSKICYLIYDMSKTYHNWPYSDSEKLRNEVDYWFGVIRLAIIYPFFICQDCILFDLSITAETAIEYIESQSKRIYKESLKDEKALHFKVIHDLRLKYLQTHRLANKMNEFISPCLPVFLLIYMQHFIYLVYLILFVQQSQFLLISRIIACIGAFPVTIVYIYSTAQVYKKSQQLLMTVYKLSLKTDYLKALNEITLFVNCNEIGFSLGGICMITSSAITTTFSFIATLIIAIPSFAR